MKCAKNKNKTIIQICYIELTHSILPNMTLILFHFITFLYKFALRHLQLCWSYTGDKYVDIFKSTNGSRIYVTTAKHMKWRKFLLCIVLLCVILRNFFTNDSTLETKVNENFWEVWLISTHMKKISTF